MTADAGLQLRIHSETSECEFSHNRVQESKGENITTGIDAMQLTLQDGCCTSLSHACTHIHTFLLDDDVDA